MRTCAYCSEIVLGTGRNVGGADYHTWCYEQLIRPTHPAYAPRGPDSNHTGCRPAEYMTEQDVRRICREEFKRMDK